MTEEIIKIAKNKIADVNENIEEQITILLSDKNVFYMTVDDMDGSICQTLKRDGDTKITKMLTMWKDGCVDISSMKFRKTLLQLDEYNNDTEIILQGTDGFVIKKLSVTIM